MSLFAARLRHATKVFVGNQIERFIRARYIRGKGPANRLISGFSAEARTIGVEAKILVRPVPVKKSTPDFCLNGEIETEYRRLLLSGENLTYNAGIFSVKDVDVLFPTSIHLVGNHILKEVMPSPYLLTNPKYYYGLQSIRFRQKRPMSEGILLSTPWHHNFYHWMIEILPRLISYDRCSSLQYVPIIVPKSAPRFVAESLKLAGYLSKVIFLDDGVYRFNTLHMLSMLSPSMDVSADAVDWLNKKFADAPSTPTAPKRVYVSRRDAKIRFVSNECDLTRTLSEFGFETIVMSDLSLADQISIFRNAECIIGPHGAAFANLVFTRPTSIFIEFYSRGHYAPCFNRLANARMLKSGFLVGEPTEIGGFSIDPMHLRAILNQALLTGKASVRTVAHSENERPQPLGPHSLLKERDRSNRSRFEFRAGRQNFWKAVEPHCNEG